MTYILEISRHAHAFLEALPEKSQRIAKDHLRELQENPYPGHGGDKKLLNLAPGYDVYRFHIGRSYTVFYRIFADQHLVRILEILTIEQAHKNYGRL